MKILVVDDSPTMRRIVVNSLKRIGYSDVCQGGDGLEGLEQLKSEAVDFIITDWNMPEMNGLDFVKKVRAKYNIEKVIFFGSRARGDNLKHSDYDIIFVSNDFEGIFFSTRIAKMYEFWNHYPLDIEPLCYTPKEFNLMKQKTGIIKQAVKEGIYI